ncbi:MAG TPA: DUF4870 domain-containing protein [Thermoanaerobaculia bacterium]
MSEIPPPTVPPATPPPPGGGSYTPPPPPPPTGGGGSYNAGGPTSPASDRTLMIILSYLGILALIPFLTKKEDPDIHWHAKNGIGLLILDVIVWVALFVIGMVLGDSLLGCGMWAVSCLVWLGILVLHIFCMIQALNGKRVRIPMLTDFAEKL